MKIIAAFLLIVGIAAHDISAMGNGNSRTNHQQPNIVEALFG